MKSPGRNPVSLSQLNIIFDSMLEGVVIHNDAGEIIQCNQSALRILGLTSDQLLGKTSFDPRWRIIHHDLTPATPETYPSFIAREKGITVKNTIMGIYQPSGKLRWVSITAIPIFKENSLVLNQVVVTFIDITEQKKDTEELIRFKDDLASRERELKVLVDSLPALVGHWDKNLINISANNLYAEYFGKSPEQIKGKHISELLGPELYELNRIYLDNVLAGKTQIFQRDIPTPNGIKNTIANYIPEINEGVVKGFFVIVTDITYLKDLERGKKVAEAKLLGAVRLSWLGEMSSGVAHEINNPLTIMLGSLSVLKVMMAQSLLTPEYFLKNIETLERSIARISNTVKGMVLFSKDGGLSQIESNKISEVVQRIENFCSERLKKHSILFDVKKNADFLFNAKKIEIIQSIVSLIYNSFDAVQNQNQNQKWIKLEVLKNGETVQFIVSDSGSAIEPDVVEKMMLPFFTTKPSGKGLGLGLSVAKSIANSHGGDLRYVHQAPQTTFIFEIKV